MIKNARRLYGVVARFDSRDRFLAAVRNMRDGGFNSIEPFTPFHMPELRDILGLRNRTIQKWALTGALLGIAAGYSLQYYAAAIGYELRVAGRPLNGVPSFIQVTFEMMVLFGSIFTLAGLLKVTGLPRLHQPVFESEEIRLVTKDGFAILIHAGDPRLDAQKPESCFDGQGAISVSSIYETD